MYPSVLFPQMSGTYIYGSKHIRIAWESVQVWMDTYVACYVITKFFLQVQ